MRYLILLHTQKIFCNNLIVVAALSPHYFICSLFPSQLFSRIASFAYCNNNLNISWWKSIVKQFVRSCCVQSLKSPLEDYSPAAPLWDGCLSSTKCNIFATYMNPNKYIYKKCMNYLRNRSHRPGSSGFRRDYGRSQGERRMGGMGFGKRSPDYYGPGEKRRGGEISWDLYC